MCECCNDARHWPGTRSARQYSPACLWCGARLIKALGRLPRPREEITSRRRSVLADWIAHGHSEAEIRALVRADALPLAPERPLLSEHGKRGR